MDYFKLAIMQKLRIQTNKGLLSSEQLGDLSIDELDSLAVSLDIEHKESGKKSFINKTSEKDATTKLKFEVVLGILNTKVEEAQRLARKKEVKEHNAKILAIMADKEDETLKGKSKKQLEAMLIDE